MNPIFEPPLTDELDPVSKDRYWRVQAICDMYHHALVNATFYEAYQLGNRCTSHRYIEEVAGAAISLPVIFKAHHHPTLAREMRYHLERSTSIARYRELDRPPHWPVDPEISSEDLAQLGPKRNRILERISKGGISSKYKLAFDHPTLELARNDVCTTYSRCSTLFHNIFKGNREFFNTPHQIDDQDAIYGENQSVAADITISGLCLSLSIILASMDERVFRSMSDLIQRTYPHCLGMHYTTDLYIEYANGNVS